MARLFLMTKRRLLRGRKISGNKGLLVPCHCSGESEVRKARATHLEGLPCSTSMRQSWQRKLMMGLA